MMYLLIRKTYGVLFLFFWSSDAHIIQVFIATVPEQMQLL